jgi:hypothetical protein
LRPPPLTTVGPKKAACRDGPIADINFGLCASIGSF